MSTSYQVVKLMDNIVANNNYALAA